jgi:hypothetical protein
MTHEWIEEYETFEAVLRCTNELGKWDKLQTLRAYQTFGWNDASPIGDELMFAHEDTGVIVRHDGDVLAIVFGDGKLSDVLGDLFSVLSALGWVHAEVFHPGETIAALLRDMAAAIPAHMDFDVHPASIDESVSTYPESLALVDRGMAALRQSELGDFHQTTLDELASMGPESKLASQPSLDDDIDDDLEVLNGSDLVHSSPLQKSGSAFGIDESPLVFIVPDSADSVSPSVEVIEEVSSATHYTSMSTNKLDVAKDAHKNHVPNGDFVQVGLSAVCFDIPTSPMSIEDVGSVADALNAEKIVHLWPGQVGQKDRWDLLNEIQDDAPWFSEKLAIAMGFDSSRAALIGCILNGLKKSDQPLPQLRDAVLTCLATLEGKSNQHQTIQSLIGDKARLLYRPESQGSRETVDQFVAMYGSVLICDDGQAFVDVRHPSNQESIQTFAIKNIVMSETPLVYVVHVDEMDGQFVLSIVELLRWVAKTYGASTKNAKFIEANLQNAERLKKKEAVNAEVKRMIEDLLIKLRQMGVEV